MRNHPVIERIERTGYPVQPTNDLMFDSLGCPYSTGDLLLEIDDKVFVYDSIDYETLTVLNLLGATRKIA